MGRGARLAFKQYFKDVADARTAHQTAVANATQAYELIGNDTDFPALNDWGNGLTGVNERTQDYGYAMADVVEEFEVDVNTAYESYVVSLASAAVTRVTA